MSNASTINKNIRRALKAAKREESRCLETWAKAQGKHSKAHSAALIAAARRHKGEPAETAMPTYKRAKELEKKLEGAAKLTKELAAMLPQRKARKGKKK